jgi:HEAT repeat protein
LARFPCPNSVRALSRLLEREVSASVKVAAVESLVESYEAGCEDALGHLLRLLGFPHESARVRLAATSVLRALPAGQRRGILARLEQDPDPVVRQKTAELVSSLHQPVPPATSSEIERLLAELGSADYAQWNEAVRRLGGIGAATVRPLVAEMRRRASDPGYCTRAGMALKALGPRRARALAEALDDVQEPLPLQVLVEVVGALGEKSMIYRLADVIERIAARPRETAEVAPLQRVRAKAHLELARVGSRVAIRDLRESLSAPARPIEPEMLAALELVGKREELGLLLRVFEGHDEFIRRGVARAVREIMKRERIRRNSRALQSLSPEQRAALARILSRPPAVARRGAQRAPEA